MGLSAASRSRMQLLGSDTSPYTRKARLVLLELLYRAFTILRGEPYHK